MKKLTNNDVAYCIENDCFMEMSIDEVRSELSKAPTTQDLYVKLNKYEQLEQELGCPLDVYVKLHKIAKIYDEKGNPLKIKQIIDENIVISTKKEINGYKLIPLNCYKKTWWLKEDRSE